MEGFITRWKGAQGAERANYQLFLSELCDALELPRPDPAGDKTQLNAYVFERRVDIPQPDGATRPGRMDLYKRGCFVIETKQYVEQQTQSDLELAVDPAPRQSKPARGTQRWDDAMLKARGQAERYARALPADEDPPPFLLIVDVGHSFELFADFTQKGKAYLPFPDPASYRFKMDDLTRKEIQERLRAVWTDPLALDPSKQAAAVTREVAAHLAELAKSFEAEEHEPKVVADFLARCLFCMFAEDVGLLPKDSFTGLLDSVKNNPGGFVPLLEGLFKEMNTGTAYSVILRQKLLRFNGGLFEDGRVLRVNGTQLGLLRAAARLNWRNVEPSIFGTLLERALNPDERHKLGAHYTPRAYVERLVLPAVIEPLREEWTHVRTAAVTHARADRLPEAIAEVRAFHDRLCHVRVLDPACGSGNFLYVTLEHMKRLEGEVLDQLNEFGDKQALLDLATITVDPHQFLGLEINPRAAAVTDLVLWIGYLQWHFRTRGKTMPVEPILRKFKNIECRDAVLAYDNEEYVTWLMAASEPDIPGIPDPVRKEIKQRADEIRANPEKFRNKMVDVWDRKSMKVDPVTGREVPDETKRTTLRRYTHPRPALWPAADFVVGNPPFLGNKLMREDLGDGYAETLRAAWPDVPESANFVMYWWNLAAEQVRAGSVRRFGLITTNNLRQKFNRRIVQAHLGGKQPLSLAFAIPDHPWVDTADGAAVRISMTVGIAGSHEGELLTVTDEKPADDGAVDVKLSARRGIIQADLTVGADVAGVTPLQANDGLSCPGVKLHGSGFIVTPSEAEALGPKAMEVIHPYRNGRDLTDEPRRVLVIDLFGLTEEEVRERYPSVYQRVLTTVKPERDQNKRAGYRDNWWIFGEPRKELRPALKGVRRYIATPVTAKHRFFCFLEGIVLPDDALISIALDDACFLGVLSSRCHRVFAFASGGVLEDRPRYLKTRCFDPFPFPVCDDAKAARIRALAEELDAHRKRVQAEQGVGLTDMYNVLEKLRASEVGRLVPSRREDPGALGQRALPALTPEEKELHDRALISTLKQLHDDLDAAVADAYGWPWPMTDAEILERVVALNKKRADEESRGTIRWLRPDYQKPKAGGTNTQANLELEEGDEAPKPKAKRAAAKQPWPETMAEQVRAVESVVVSAGKALTAEQIARRFRRARTAAVQEILDTLADLGRI